jgi:hypothetical protein
MAFKSRAVTVTDTATRLDSDEADTRYAGSAVGGKNVGANTIYVGGGDVTTANGVPVAAGEWLPGVGDINQGDKLYAVCAAGLTSEVRMLEVGV